MPDVRYGHYTTTAGLLGIVGREKLWATNIKFLNDEHELVHAVELVKEIVSTQKRTPGGRMSAAFEEYKAHVNSKLDPPSENDRGAGRGHDPMGHH
jgi:hypothetical protein